MFFEIDDVKRRHSVYFDSSNVWGWIDTPDSNFGYNYLRGVGAALPAFAIGETWKLWRENWKLLRTKYEPPANLKQFSIYCSQIMKMNNFKKGIYNRLQHATLISFFDYGLRWGVYRWCTEGIYRPYAQVDHQFWRRIIPTLFASAVTSVLSVPFEVARACYYGDRTYPKELRKNYTSPLNALLRIPREEGPWYLFRNSFPIIARNFASFSFLCYLYDFMTGITQPFRHGEVATPIVLKTL
jgi:solute carrier family 25 oxoglutarate transporter 11